MPSTRSQWIDLLTQIVRPVLTALAAEQLRTTMPVEEKPGLAVPRRDVCCLEAFGRTMLGLTPWLESNTDEPQRIELAALAQRALINATNPQSPDFLNFANGAQPLVDAAFLAHAILRAPNLLWHSLPQNARQNIIAAILSTRGILPGWCNWLLFSATVEAFLSFAGEKPDLLRFDYALRQHEQWYKGDGIYGDGPRFHFDYYNSYVIQPMLLDILPEAQRHDKRWNSFAAPILARAQRFAVIQERFIASDGSFPAIGRSLAYRCGAFQLLAQLALQQKLPAELPPAQVRNALTLVIDRTLRAPNTFDANHWLTIGLCGHQPAIGENYISTGSLYLCTAAFLPLGLPPENPFWSAPSLPTTSQKVWSGIDVPADHAIDVQSKSVSRGLGHDPRRLTPVAP